jgi:hypothetical protein
MRGGGTYASAVFIRNMAVCEGIVDLRLVLCRELVIAVDKISVAPARFDQVLDLRGSDTSPVLVSRCSQRNGKSRRDIPVAVRPTLMPFNIDLDSKAERALRELLASLLAFRHFAAGAIVGSDVCV